MKDTMLAISILIIASTFSVFSQSSKNSMGDSDTLNSAQKTIILSLEDKNIVDKMELATKKEVQNYVREIINSDIPKKSSIDDKYISPSNYVEASKLLGQDYPFFYQKNGVELLEKVKSRPLEFRKMIIEYKLLRQHYDEY